MVERSQFRFNADSAATNGFMVSDPELRQREITARTMEEFAGLVAVLRAHEVEVEVIDGRHALDTPDAVFPNNWFLTEGDRLVLYPMAPPSRRAERRPDIIHRLKRKGYTRVVDLTSFESSGKYLEGTGSLVLDRVHRIAYAGYSARTHPEPLQAFADELGYRVHAFEMQDAHQRQIYRTNVMLSVGTRVAVACLEALQVAQQRVALRESLEATGHTLIPISLEQMTHFCGNVLELQGPRGETFWVMSAQARQSFTPLQINTFEADGKILWAPLPLIEKLGGGSARCMIAELA